MIIAQLVCIGVCVGFGIAIGMAVSFGVQTELARFRRHLEKKARK